jgi:hypothetical protein
MPLGRVAVAINDHAGYPGIWEVSKVYEAATFSAASGMGALIYTSDDNLWITHWIDLGDGSTKVIRFSDPSKAIDEIESRGIH